MIDTSCNTFKHSNTTFLKNSSKTLQPISLRTKGLKNRLIDSNIIKSKALEQETLVKNSKLLEEKQAEKKQKYLEKSNKFYEEYNFGIPKYNQFKPKFSLQKIEDFLDEKISSEKGNGFFSTKTKLNKNNKNKFYSFGDNIFSPKPKIFHLTKISQNNNSKSISERKSIIKDENNSIINSSPKEKNKLKKNASNYFSNNLSQQSKKLKINTEENSEDEKDFSEMNMNVDTTTNFNRLFQVGNNNNNSSENFNNVRSKNSLKHLSNNNYNFSKSVDKFDFNLTAKNNENKQIPQGNSSIYSYNNIFNSNKNKENNTLYSKNNRVTFRTTDAVSNKNITRSNKYYQTNLSMNSHSNTNKSNYLNNINNNIDHISNIEPNNNLTNSLYKYNNYNNSIYNNNKQLIRLESSEQINDDKISDFCITGRSEVNEYEDLIVDKSGKNNNFNSNINNKFKPDTKININKISNQSLHSFESSKKTNFNNTNYIKEDKNPCGITLPYTFNEFYLSGNIPNNLNSSRMKFLKKKEENLKKEKISANIFAQNFNNFNLNSSRNNKNSNIKNINILRNTFPDKITHGKLYKFEKKFEKSRKKVNLPETNLYHFEAQKTFINNYDEEKMSLSLKLNPVINYPDLVKDKKRFTEFFEKNTQYMIKDSKKKQDKLLYI